MDLEPELLKSMQREELEALVAERIKSFHGFLTREVALRLIAKEKGLLKSEEKSYRLADIPKGERRCVMFGGLGRSDRLMEGDEVIIEGATVRMGNIEIDSHTRMLSRRRGEMLLGQITRLETRDSELLVEVGGKEAIFDRQDALRFMGVQAADDIALSTVVGLKKGSLLNNRIAVKIERKDGQIVVRC
jgi:hypothetical protein